MTTILAIQGNGYAVVCSDSRITEDSGCWQPYTSAQPKIAGNGKYLLGAAGDLRAINILHNVFKPPEVNPKLRGKLLDKFMSTKFVPALRECFETTGYATPPTTGPNMARHDSDILAVINATIYIIGDDYSWFQDMSGIYALGSGKDYAFGALHCLVGKKVPSVHQCKAVVLRAIAVAAKFNCQTGAPFHVFTQTG